MNTNIENIIDKIVAGRNKYKGEVTLKVDRDVLFDIGDDYLKIRQRGNEIGYHSESDDRYPWATITVEGIDIIPNEIIENQLIPALETRFSKLFFTPEYYPDFQYRCTFVLDFLSASGHHGHKMFKLENTERKADLKQRLDSYVQRVIWDATEPMKEEEVFTFFYKIFDFNLTQYTEDELISILEKGISLINPKHKKMLKKYQDDLLYNSRRWKEDVFMKLYYNVKKLAFSKEYTLKEGFRTEDVDTVKLNLFVQQALWHIKYKKYSWDVKFACEDLERAANELGSEKAKQYLKKGTGELPDNLIHYKDSELEADANDVFATISLKIKQETTEAYGKALDFVIALLKGGFPHSYQIKFSSKAPKQFLDIKGLAKSSTHRFFAQALQYETLHSKLEEYAKVAMKEFEWYTDVEEGEKSCMPGSYAVFGLGLTDKKYFPLVIEYFKLVDDEHQMVHKNFVSALIEQYGFSAETLSMIYEGVISSQDDVVFKSLTEAMKNPENKALLNDFLKDKEDYYQEAMYYAVYGKNWEKKK